MAFVMKRGDSEDRNGRFGEVSRRFFGVARSANENDSPGNDHAETDGCTGRRDNKA